MLSLSIDGGCYLTIDNNRVPINMARCMEGGQCTGMDSQDFKVFYSGPEYKIIS